MRRTSSSSRIPAWPSASVGSTLLSALLALGVGGGSIACAKPPPPPPPKPAPPPPRASASVDPGPLPPHLASFPGLYVRKGAEIVEAPEADVAVAKSYPRAADKGPLVDGHRLTLLTAKRRYRVGEEIRVLHVHEVLSGGEQVWPMGPKPIRGEHVDGKLVTPAVLGDSDPFVPAVYDGPVLAAPAVDYHWEITSYRFSAPGRRTIQWKLGKYASNVLVLEIVK